MKTYSPQGKLHYYIYKLAFESGKVYIGQTKDYEQRIRQHKGVSIGSKIYDNSRINQALRKYEWDKVEKEILCICYAETVDELETDFIKLYKSNNRDYGYNIEVGGKSNKDYIKPVKELTKEKMSEAAKGNGSRSKPVLQFDLDGHFVKEWSSCAEAGRELGLNYKGICSVASGKIIQQKTKTGNITTFRGETAGGFKWRYKDENSVNTQEHIKVSRKKKIIQLDLEGNEIKVWDSIVEASKVLGVSRGGITQAASDKPKKDIRDGKVRFINQVSCGGFKWKYADDGVEDCRLEV